ncbi:MAG: hypothetical protein IPH76_17670 [Xanthomonadales bacterium]|nr:hypothetical protein [Xanthomonadales bacterium]
MTVFAARSDQIVPVEDVRAFAVAVPLLHRYHEVDSVFGHDSFLKGGCPRGKCCWMR